MDEAKQAFCVLAGSREYLRDSIINAMMSKNQIFRNLNMLVVPVEMTASGKGMGRAVNYEDEGYVAVPVNVSFACSVCRLFA